jgi:S1-C subfamily serine protease
MRTILFLIAVAISPVISDARATSRSSPPGWLGVGYIYNETATGRSRTVWLFVQQTARDGPAERAGLKPQDVITAINGRPLWFHNESDALSFFSGVRIGDSVVLRVRRGRETLNVTIVAGTPPARATEIRKNNEQIVKAHQARH